MKIVGNMVLFWGDEDIFSNFHPAKFIFHVGEDIQFTSSEQAFMYMKARFFDDLDAAKKVLEAKTPYEAKKIGRTVKNFDEAMWSTVSELVMYDVNAAKYSQNLGLFEGLIATRGKELVEASKFDKIWGTGFAEDDTRGHDKSNWPADCNKLGRVLTRLRDDMYASME